MIVFFQNITHDNIAVFDAEYNEGDLIQFAGTMFRRIGEGLYQISGSINIYVKLKKDKKVNRFIKSFTGITDAYLDRYGVELEKATEEIFNFFEVKGTLGILAHDIQNDIDILYDNCIDLDLLNAEYLCSYRLAQRILGENRKLNLETLSLEAGFQHSNSHNAMDDAWATTAVFCLLKKLEFEEKDEDEKVL